MKDQAMQILRRLTEAHGAPSGEGSVRDIVRGEIHGVESTDAHGSIIIRGDGAPTPRVMLEAHMDEVGFMIQSITPEGFLRLVPLGSWWEHTLLAQRMRILTQNHGEVLGVVAAKSPHHLNPDERSKLMKIEDMHVDVGADCDVQVKNEFGIAVGDLVVPDSSFTRLRNPDLLLGKAFDNRIGVALLIQATQALLTKGHPNTLYAVGAVQEEVGTRGAKTATHAVNPDLAIVLEGPPADDGPGERRQECQGKLGGGPQLRLMDPSAILHRPFTGFARHVAEECGIPYQLAVRRSGATDAKVIHLHATGVPTIVIGIPARYIHTHNSMVHLQDYLHGLRLVIELVQRLNDETYRSLVT